LGLVSESDADDQDQASSFKMEMRDGAMVVTPERDGIDLVGELMKSNAI